MKRELSSDELRRDLREVDEQHRDSLTGFRSALHRIFLSGSYDEGTQRDFVLAGMNRRSVLRFGGATILGGAVLAACGSDKNDATATTVAGAATTAAGTATTVGSTMAPATTAMGTDTTAAAMMSQDVVILRTASSLEEVAVAAYQLAIDSGLVTTSAIVDAAKLFQSHHKEHSALFQGATKKAGGEPFAKPNPAVLALFQPKIDALKTENDVVALALQLEMAAAQTYQSTVSLFTDMTLNVAAMSVGGVEARHAAVLATVLGQPAVPKAFQVTDMAVKAGTGV
jgi:hypothetical protein